MERAAAGEGDRVEKGIAAETAIPSFAMTGEGGLAGP
jgi:hypothetical protein